MKPFIREATDADRDAVWRIMEPVIRTGETYAHARDMTKAEALAHWFQPDRTVFVAEEGGHVIGTYYLRANRPGPGSHVANAGFMVAEEVGGQGIGQALCTHALTAAKAAGFLAMQFNFVVASNTRAVRLWQRMGFDIVGRVPDAFLHPVHGMCEALVMHRRL